MTVPPDAPARLRIVGLDGLRGILAIAVVVTHAAGHLAPELTARLRLDVLGLAIVTFFVISGFLIAMPFLARIERGRPVLQRMGDYALSRILRIYPSYLLALLLSALVLRAAYLDNAMLVASTAPGVAPGPDAVGPMDDPVRLLLHGLLVQNYLPSELQTGLSASWTLTVELAFYVAMPFLVAASAAVGRRLRWRSTTTMLVPGIVLVATSLAGRLATASLERTLGMTPVVAEWGPTWLAVLSRSLVVWADGFGLGMLAAVLVLAVRDGRAGSTSVARWRAAAWAAVPVSVVACGISYAAMPRLLPAAFAVLSVAALLLLVLPVGAERGPWLGSRLVDNRVLRWLGTVSLGIYVWHFPVLLLWERTGLAIPGSAIGILVNSAVVLAGSTAIASVSYVLVERPALRLRALLPRDRRAADGSPPSARSTGPAHDAVRGPRPPGGGS